jgi:glutathione peroxidase
LDGGSFLSPQESQVFQIRAGMYSEEMIHSEDLAEIELVMLDGSRQRLGDHLNKVLMVVNVASRCGFSPHYGRLEAMYKRLAERGLTVLGLPSNQFFQELDSEEDIKTYCSITWGVTFPMTARVDLDGDNQHPLYKKLTQVNFEDGTGGPVRWNFEKFLIPKGGPVVRIAHDVKPDSEPVLNLIDQYLQS